METHPAEGVLKEEKFPHSGRPSHWWVCGEICNLRRQHNITGKRKEKLQNTSLTATAEKRTFPRKAIRLLCNAQPDLFTEQKIE